MNTMQPDLLEGYSGRKKEQTSVVMSNIDDSLKYERS